MLACVRCRLNLAPVRHGSLSCIAGFSSSATSKDKDEARKLSRTFLFKPKGEVQQQGASEQIIQPPPKPTFEDDFVVSEPRVDNAKQRQKRKKMTSSPLFVKAAPNNEKIFDVKAHIKTPKAPVLAPDKTEKNKLAERFHFSDVNQVSPEGYPTPFLKRFTALTNQAKATLIVIFPPPSMEKESTDDIDGTPGLTVIRQHPGSAKESGKPTGQPSLTETVDSTHFRILDAIFADFRSDIVSVHSFITSPNLALKSDRNKQVFLVEFTDQAICNKAKKTTTVSRIPVSNLGRKVQDATGDLYIGTTCFPAMNSRSLTLSHTSSAMYASRAGVSQKQSNNLPLVTPYTRRFWHDHGVQATPIGSILMRHPRAVSKQINELYNVLKADAFTVRRGMLHASLMHDLCKTVFGSHASVVPFGSLISGLGTAHSDVDVVLDSSIESNAALDFSDSSKPLVLTNKNQDVTIHEMQASLLSAFAPLLAFFFPHICHVYPIPNARIPIIKMRNQMLSVSSDLSFASSVPHIKIAEMFYGYSALYPFIGPVFATIRIWGDNRRVTTSKPNNILSNFQLTMFFFHFLQTTAYKDGIFTQDVPQDSDNVLIPTIKRLRQVCSSAPILTGNKNYAMNSLNDASTMPTQPLFPGIENVKCHTSVDMDNDIGAMFLAFLEYLTRMSKLCKSPQRISLCGPADRNAKNLHLEHPFLPLSQNNVITQHNIQKLSFLADIAQDSIKRIIEEESVRHFIPVSKYVQESYQSNEE